MKKTFFVLIILSVFLLTSCAPSQNTAIQMVNPVKKVSSPADFEPLGVCLSVPDTCEDVVYTTINDFIAQIDFTLDENAYTFRGAISKDDISGIYETFEEQMSTICADSETKSVTIEIKAITNSGGTLAAWKYGDAIFTLYSKDVTALDTMGQTALMLSFDHSDSIR